VDGGGNIDTLELDGSGLTLDLTNISNIRIQDIEKIDITGSGDTLRGLYTSIHKTKATGSIPFLHNNQINILLNPKRSISIGTLSKHLG
jgi:hypothetical protein